MADKKLEELIEHRREMARASEALRQAALVEAQRAEQPLRHVDPNFTHKALVATARNEGGMRRSGVYVGPEKTLIPANTFKSQAAYDAFVNERGLVVDDAPTSKAEVEQLKTVDARPDEVESLESHTVPELREMALDLGVTGVSSMNKAKLIRAIGQAQSE